MKMLKVAMRIVLLLVIGLQLIGCAHFSSTARAFRYIERGNTQQAIKILTNEISNNPNDHLAYFYRGVAYSQEKDNAKAITDFTKSIEINPTFYYSYFNRALLYRDIKEYKLALNDVNKAISSNPDVYIIYVLKGNIYERLKDNREAMASYDKALLLQPNDLDALLSKANILYYEHDYKEALKCDNILLTLYSQNSPMVCNDIAWKLVMCPEKQYRNVGEALSLAQKAYKMFPCFVTCDTLAAVYAEKNDFKTAIKYQQEAIERVSREQSGKELEEFLNDLNERLESYQKNVPWEEGVDKHRRGVIMKSGLIKL